MNSSSAITINETASNIMINAGISIVIPMMNISKLISIFADPLVIYLE